MARRSSLKAVASGIAGSFISRNNDFAGYWALGLLRQLVDQAGLRHIRIGLIGEDSEMKTDLVDSISRTYALKLFTLLPAAGFSIASVTSAYIDVEFGSLVKHAPPGVGDPFLCTVSLIDDVGKTRTVSLLGRCRTHDPLKETRSNRASKWARIFDEKTNTSG